MTIFYIGGYGRSGSTVLDRAIATSLGGISLGEVVFFPRSVYFQESCSCGQLARNCSFWNQPTDYFLTEHRTIRFHSFKEDGLWGLLVQPSQMYERVQRSIFRHQRSMIYCDSSKTCRHAIFRPLSLKRLFPNDLIFVWIKRPLIDTVKYSLVKGTNQQLEDSSNSKGSSVRILRGIIGYIAANLVAWMYVKFVFRCRSIVIDQRLLRSSPNLVISRIRDFLTCRSIGKRSEAVDSSIQCGHDEWLGDIHQIAGNRNRFTKCS